MFRFMIISLFALLVHNEPIRAETSSPSENLLQLAIEYSDMDLLDIVMKYGTDFKYPALNKAMDEGDYTAVQILIEYGSDVNSRRDVFSWDGMSLANGYYNKSGTGKTIIEKAIELENISLVEYFLLKNANPLNFRTVTHQSHYTKNGKREEHVEKYVTTALYDAIKLGRMDIVISIVRSSIDLNAICYQESLNNGKNQLTLTPIQAAIRLNQRDIVSLLLSLGVKI